MLRPAFGVVALALLVGAAAPVTAQQGGQKFAFINSRVVLAQMPGYSQAESTYTKEVEGYRAEVERLQSSLDSAGADFDQQSVMLSPSARTAKRKDLQAQQDKLEQRANELRDRAAERERELLEPLHAKVNDAIDAVRSEGNYAMIFDVSAGNGLIVAADKSLDVTDKVVAKLKARP